MFINNFDPVAFDLFSIEIRWYSIAYILGIILGWAYCKKKLIKNTKVLNLFDDLVAYIIIGIMRSKQERTYEEPFVSIIVYAHNEERNISRCIQKLLLRPRF